MKSEADLLEQVAALAMVARLAGGHEVFPRVAAALALAAVMNDRLPAGRDV